jgi:hypothetical protein
VALLLDCNLDAHAIRSLLREKLPDIKWKLGDSEHEGFYVLGHTETGVRVKITEESEADGSTLTASGRRVPRRYYVGVHFFGSKEDVGRFRKFVRTILLQRRVRRAITAEIGG